MSANHISLAMSLASLEYEKCRHGTAGGYLQLDCFRLQRVGKGYYGLRRFRIWHGERRLNLSGLWIGTRAQRRKLCWLADEEAEYLRQQRQAWED